MKGYVSRMIAEHKELKDRIQKLKAKVDDVDFLASIGEKKAGLLFAQYHAMETYDFILVNRLSVECDEGNCTVEEVNGETT